MKNIKNNKGKVLKEIKTIKLKDIKMSKQLLLSLIKSEIMNFYTQKLIEFNDLKSESEKERIIDLLEKIANKEYDALIHKALPKDFPFDYSYNVNIGIIDEFVKWGKLELKIDLSLSSRSKVNIISLNEDNSWLTNLGLL
ncbi:hypothetical protein ACQRXC_13360 [Niallia taxi]|uniref:hypothetical protein n=1 Tax=Niallia taxi TaxID=2499688 RepID=UPI003F64840F